MHGLEGDIRHGGNVNGYYDDLHAATGAFDFVLANPPFNVNAVARIRRLIGVHLTAILEAWREHCGE